MKRTRNIVQPPFGLILVLVGLMSVAMSALEPFALAGADPSWIPTGSLNIPRSGHTATLLANGKMLVVGGYDNPNNRLNSAELYDPASGRWSITGSLNTPRAGHTATLLSDGKVLVAGGHTFPNSTELYDPATGTWSVTGSLNIARYGHTATLLPDGRLLVAGGITGHAPSTFYTNSVEVFDPATASWTFTGGLTTARAIHTATRLQNGKILVVGGTNDTIGFPVQAEGISSAELYDSATETWSITGSLNVARNSHTATLLPNGKVLAAGGWFTNSAELYDPATGTWNSTGALHTLSVGGHTATLLRNGQVLLTGGWSGFSPISDAQPYDPATGNWRATTSLSTARNGHTATLLPNGKVLVAGGYDVITSINGPLMRQTPIYLNSAELYDISIQLVAAVLPSSRSVSVGTPATAFATLINTDSNTATGCTISLLTSIPANFTYQTTDPATNQVTGFGNTPVDIPAGAAQSFVFALTPNTPMAPTDLQLSFDCANADPAPIISGLNTFLFSASATPVADILALVATLTNDGIVNVPGSNGTGVFAVATVNMGAGDVLTVTADTGDAILPVNIFICQTDPQTGACFSPPATSVPTTILSNETPTFGVFAAAAGDVSFVPETNRIFVRFKDSSNVTRGLTSVAVRTQ
jgi:N-acetylneuraminic acid mutarotase